ncbi:MAG: hypothetical protein ACJ75T_05950 [Solirubrobacterales bacterium]
MRPSRLFIIALSVLATSCLAPSLSLAATTDGVLSMAAARDAARSVGWDVARRNPLVTSVEVGPCRRRASDRIHCHTTARGSSSTLKTTCEISVRVTLADNRPEATHQTNCDNEPQPILRAFQALEAVRPTAEDLGGEGVILYTYGRTSRTRIHVQAGWIQPAPEPGKDEVCSVIFEVALTSSETIVVKATDSICVVSKT